MPIIVTKTKKTEEEKRLEELERKAEELSFENGGGKKKREKVYRERKFAIVAFLLIISVLLGMFTRGFVAAPYVSDEDIIDFTGVTCEITDRFDQPIYKDGAVLNYGIYGNIIGHKDNIHNSLIYRHSDILNSDSLNPVVGYRSLETKPRVMKTTLLSEESQKDLAAMFKGKKGCCFAFNYETGEIYTALSLPEYNPNKSNTEYINRCFSSVYIPGSTMKIVTAILAVDQGKNMSKITYTCNGSYILSDGNEIKCMGNHGTIGFSTAISRSCNCYFAQLIMSLNLEKALATLKELGFSVNTDKVEDGTIDGINKKGSSVNITNTASFKNIWGLIGQGHTQVNPIDMAKIAAAVVNKGNVAQPYMITSVINPNANDKVIYSNKTESDRIIKEKTAEKTAGYWKMGVNMSYYSFQGMSREIDYAKTGTAEQGDGNDDRLLIGVAEAYKTAFFIVVEDTKGAPSPMTIANKLVTLLPN